METTTERFADIEDTKRLRQEVDHDRQNLEARLEDVKDVLPLVEQITVTAPWN